MLIFLSSKMPVLISSYMWCFHCACMNIFLRNWSFILSAMFVIYAIFTFDWQNIVVKKKYIVVSILNNMTWFEKSGTKVTVKSLGFTIGHDIWQPLQGLQSWYHIMISHTQRSCCWGVGGYIGFTPSVDSPLWSVHSAACCCLFHGLYSYVAQIQPQEGRCVTYHLQVNRSEVKFHVGIFVVGVLGCPNKSPISKF